ncbi:hypothetical protein WN51_00340 [Melipona quadrifasciata]|uniref:Uncharacterized protein n=1 Tax=Melipona quadrifasciata TaxID=166423 RepID=A0A0M9A0C1_9HYME|nr:hypothetical protein WN51_00340 [Melipona quadrifasciata]
MTEKPASQPRAEIPARGGNRAEAVRAPPFAKPTGLLHSVLLAIPLCRDTQSR